MDASSPHQTQDEAHGSAEANAHNQQQPERQSNDVESASGQEQQQALNPAAAAAAVSALAQLAQFGGSMSAAERTTLELQLTQFAATILPPQFMHYAPQAGRFPYRGGGFRNRGRGRGRRGRGDPTHNPQSFPEPSAAEVLKSNEEKEPSTDNHNEESQAEFSHQASTTAARGNIAPNQHPVHIAWCELCRVSCTSFEILEQQHKNGKKHQKNLQRFGGLNNAYRSVTDLNPASTLQPENVQEGEENKPTEAVAEENKMETEQNNEGAKQPEISGEEQVTNATMIQLDNLHGMKRKMRGGRGGKRMKISNVWTREMEPPKPKVVIPLICDLCNVKCDTQEVFDRHLAGKKHISKLKRYEDHQAMYGPMGLHALYPPNPITQTLFHTQGPQGFYGPQDPHLPSQAPHEVLAGTGEVHEAQQQSASVEPETKQAKTVQIHAGNGVSGSEVVGPNPPPLGN